MFTPHATKVRTDVSATHAGAGARSRAFCIAALAVLSLTPAAWAAPKMLVTHTDGVDIFVVEDGGTVDFGDVEIGEQAVFLFQVLNQGDGALSMSSLSASIATGNVSADQAGFSQVFDRYAASILFTMTAAGTGQLDIQMTSNDPASPFSFTLQANGVAARMTVADGLELLDTDSPLELDPVEVGQTGGAAVVVRNVGNIPLEFLGANEVVELTELSGGDVEDFTVELGADDLAPGGFRVMTIAFEPTSVGPREVLAEIATNDPDSPYAFTILAEGLEPVVEITDCNFNDVEDADDIAAGNSEDCDFDGIPDECQTDSDDDGVIDPCDRCPGEDDGLDTDGDDTPDCLDNCPETFNPQQLDDDGDGIGNACEQIEDVNTNGQDQFENEEYPIQDNMNDNEADQNNDNFNENDNVDENINDNVDENNTDENQPPFEEDENRKAGFCGAGALGMIPMMMFGLCGMKPRKARSRKE